MAGGGWCVVGGEWYVGGENQAGRYRCVLVRLRLVVGDESECRFDPFGNGAGSPALGVYEDPIGFAFRKYNSVGSPHEFVPPQGTNATEVDDPCAGLDSIIKKGRPQILDVVRAYDPRSTDSVHRIRRAGGSKMPNGDVNHPSQVGDVVDVPVPIDRFLWNIELVLINTFR